MPASRVLPAPVGARPWLVLDGSPAWAYARVVCLPLGEVIYVRG